MPSWIVWILANYKVVLVDALAVDRVLIAVFPGVSIFGTIANFLSPLVPASLKRKPPVAGK